MRALSRIAVALLALAGAVLSAAPGHAQGRERILNFVSDIKVERNGDLFVMETIRVYATGDVIRRGIFRDFPTSYTTRNGTRIEVAFEVRSVMRDGAAENYTTERITNGTRVRIGSADRMVSRGEHEYSISYRTTRQVGFLKDYDELYWNVTGNGWTFPIDQAEARITLPEPVPFGQTAVYTGRQGETGKAAEVVEQRPGRIVFRTTAPLDAHSGLTVAASWDKGIVIAPTDAERWAFWARDNLPVALAFAALAVLIGYLVLAWRVAGRDPERGTMVPLFAPPAGMSAAAVRYVNRMAMDDKTFTAAIIDIAVRGHAKLVEKKTEGMRLLPRKGGAVLPAPETEMERKLFGKNASSLDLDQKNHGALERARAALEAGLSKAYLDKLFHENDGWAWRGAVFAVFLCIIVLVAAFGAWGENEGWAILSGAVCFVPMAVVIAVGVVKGPQATGGIIAFLFVGLIAAVLAAGYGVSNYLSASGIVHAVPSLLPVLLVPLAASAFSWMKAHTREGRAITDQIEGFRHYLSVAERERLEALNPPQETAELFEKYLPYAIALDVENEWGKRFATVLAAAAVGAAAHHVASTTDSGWYQGSRDWSDWSSNPAGFASYLGDKFTDTIAAAAVPPAATTTPGSSSFDSSSSSYSGGSDSGGSSGGGGGGGGGSGW